MRLRTLTLWLLSLSLLAGAEAPRGLAGTSAATSAPASGARVALVIGNGAYEFGSLSNPANDAADMAAALTACGFRVLLKTDCDLKTMKGAIEELGTTAQGAEAAVFYYAGHGLQVDGRNYLVPVGARPQGPSDVEFECLDVERVLAKLEDAKTLLNVVILDSCRNNPLGRSWSRSAPSGLAAMDAPQGTILAFATAAGSTAADGQGRNGRYTECLLKHLQTPGLDIVDLFRRTAADVKAASGGAQIPWLSLSYTGTFTLLAQGASTPPPPPPPPMTGNLQVNVNAPNATVKVDGREMGRADPAKPLDLTDLPVGEVTVEVSAQGYEPQTKRLKIDGGEQVLQAFQLSPSTVAYRQASLPSSEECPHDAVPKELIPSGAKFLTAYLGDYDGDGIREYAAVFSKETPEQGSQRHEFVVAKLVAGIVAVSARLDGFGDDALANIELVSDLDGDGGYEFVISSSDMGSASIETFYIVDCVGGSYQLFPTKLMRRGSGVFRSTGRDTVACDLDGDGRDEIFLGEDPFYCSTYDDAETRVNFDAVYVWRLANWTNDTLEEVTERFSGLYLGIAEKLEMEAQRTPNATRSKNARVVASQLRAHFLR
jgi:hypothetical protein